MYTCFLLHAVASVRNVLHVNYYDSYVLCQIGYRCEGHYSVISFLQTACTMIYISTLWLRYKVSF